MGSVYSVKRSNTLKGTKRHWMAQIAQEKRKEKVIEVLNKARAMELHAIHQYMNQHYNLDNWD
jgi:rubrerythrin